MAPHTAYSDLKYRSTHGTFPKFSEIDSAEYSVNSAEYSVIDSAEYSVNCAEYSEIDSAEYSVVMCGAWQGTLVT